MNGLHLHVLNARGRINDHNSWISEALLRTYDRVARMCQVGPLDVVVRADGRVIPEKGHVGYAIGPGVIFVTVDPNNPALARNDDSSLERMFAHELHHAVRWDGPGYGTTLGEALVSEGLAGHFVLEVFGGRPEPWERLGPEMVDPYRAEARAAWADAGYAHGDWFFGTGTKPRWLGYSLGFDLVGRALRQGRGETAASLAHADAARFVTALT